MVVPKQFAFKGRILRSVVHEWGQEIWEEEGWYIWHRDGKTYHPRRWWSIRDRLAVRAQLRLMRRHW
jgi:hypothetical protein